jgi:hypothetical protein
MASRGIEERFLDCADRLFRRSEEGRKSRSDSLGMTGFAAAWKDAGGANRAAVLEKGLTDFCAVWKRFCRNLERAF